jgi:hypothetical protein
MWFHQKRDISKVVSDLRVLKHYKQSTMVFDDTLPSYDPRISGTLIGQSFTRRLRKPYATIFRKKEEML